MNGWLSSMRTTELCHGLCICRSVISTGDMYNFHFIKNEILVSLQEGGNLFSLPLSSSIQFGLLYNPKGDTLIQALRGYSYRTIGDLMECSIPPRVVRATKTSTGGKPTSSVNSDEILIITKFGCLSKWQPPYVKAFSLHTRT